MRVALLNMSPTMAVDSRNSGVSDCGVLLVPGMFVSGSKVGPLRLDESHIPACYK